MKKFLASIGFEGVQKDPKTKPTGKTSIVKRIANAVIRKQQPKK